MMIDALMEHIDADQVSLSVSASSPSICLSKCDILQPFLPLSAIEISKLRLAFLSAFLAHN